MTHPEDRLPVSRAARPPWRFWVTGCLAVVALTAAGTRVQHSGQKARTSRYSTEETIQRLAASAEAHGLSVFAHIPLGDARGGAWLVLGGSREETALIQHSPQAPMNLPLTLRITARGDSASSVQFHDRAELADQALPGELMAHVAVLPALVDDALS
jgi:uncharacterized protein (DUF302 family)